ncbi:MAG: 23S rRNA (adenine(2503)-C(2))-methyltransferase RlmN [Planctomycetes bacterium]|nr:23S rRNA (adenine(2503)-C(2))-methyltransferase RlmN [Planctomycetota bacterium]
MRRPTAPARHLQPMPPTPVTDHDSSSLRDALVAMGEKAFRAGQILRHVYRRCALSYDEMTDLPAELRERLKTALPLLSTGRPEEKKSKDGTVKLLVPCADGQPVECVMIPEPPGKVPPERRTVCVSTQAGCPVGCVFCASGLAGLARNLTAGEIVEQVTRQGRLVRDRFGGIDHPISNVVFMGMGEPFYNLERVIGAIERLNADWGMGIGLNRITVSTVGVEGGVGKLAAHPLAPNLALSLHAPNDEIRRAVVPFTKALTVSQLVSEGVKYREKTGKEVTCEYVMLADVNSRPEHARELAKRVSGRGLKVNLIPYNEVEGLAYKAPAAREVAEFARILEAAGVPCPVRRARGDRIAAACGQLRLRKMGATT